MADGTLCDTSKLEISKSGAYTESDLQDILFEHPSLIPAAEIDPTFKDLIPICTELSTSAGRLDILLITREGFPVCVETKLWRNAEARRAVVAQILEYGSELSRWSAEDLQRVVKNRTGRRLFDIVREHDPTISEPEFLDNISRSLKNGRFLLLVCGDGIRETTENISRFFNESGHFEFVFALIEIGIFETNQSHRIYQPRTLARTQVLKLNATKDRFNDDPIRELNRQSNWSEALDNTNDKEQAENREFWLEFWEETAAELDFDDPNHLEFKPERRFRAAGLLGNISDVYLLSYFSKTENKIGVALSFSVAARPLFNYLRSQSKELEYKIGYSLKWSVKSNGRQSVGINTEYLDPVDPDQRKKASSWFAKTIVEFDNTLRPALEQGQIAG